MEEIVTEATAGATTAETSTTGEAGTLVQFVQAYGSGTLAAVSDAISALGGIAIATLLSILLTFYAMRDGPEAWARFLERFEPGRRSYVGAAGGRAFAVLGGYMLGTSAISLFGAISQFVIMTILGIPFALPLAVLSFFGGFIPYIGSAITTGLAFLVTVATGSDSDIVIMAIYTIAFNIIQGNFVAPLVYSAVVSLHPAVVLVAIPAGNEIAGIIGMFLVVPFLGVVATTWRTVLRVLDTEEIEPIETPAQPEDIPEPALSSAPDRLSTCSTADRRTSGQPVGGSGSESAPVTRRRPVPASVAPRSPPPPRPWPPWQPADRARCRSTTASAGCCGRWPGRRAAPPRRASTRPGGG